MSVATYQPQWIKADFIDFVLTKIDPLLSLHKAKAKVVTQHALSTDMYQVTLAPNRKFSRNWQAGQSILLSVQIAGVFHQRSYSIVEITAQGHIVLGIKAQGLVSRYLTTNRSDFVVELSQAQGDFVLQEGSDTALLIASGSGITAIYAMLKQALQQNMQQVYVLYFNRTPVYHFAMQQLADQYPQFNYRYIDTSKQKQHFDEALLTHFCPDWQSMQSYVCGSSALMSAVKTLYAKYDQSERLHSEYFQPVISTAAEQPITFRRSQRDFMATDTVLNSAEKAGLRPNAGCRMGICNTCTCTKVSGITKNILTGEIDTEDHRPIKLCISQALSPVVIDL